MNKQPVYYMQTDPRWKNADYSAPGESTTIGRAGCGPTCMAMVIATLYDPPYTPVDACAWAKAHGYKAKGQGTYYSYFRAHGLEYGLTVEQLNSGSLRNLSAAASEPYHQRALEAIQAGDWVIACMGPGLWTSGGHYILWWGREDDKCRINDPASTRTDRTHGDLARLRREVKYYWVVHLPKEEDDMTQDQFDAMMDNWLARRAELAPSDWSKDARAWAEGKGLVQGDDKDRMGYQTLMTKEAVVELMHRQDRQDCG